MLKPEPVHQDSEKEQTMFKPASLGQANPRPIIGLNMS